jgi:16S rRNA (guanine(966)-N(2))-methyltransferase RsmD
MAVRVIAGAAHGRRLRVPAAGTRPTAGVVRGALFNMLAHRGWLDGALVLDLFAGSGALGIEALSRGVRRVVFVEANSAAARVLAANLAQSGLAARGEVLRAPVFRALATLAARGVLADGVFADPPYGLGWPSRTVAAVAKSGVLAPAGWLAVEHRVDEEPQVVGDLVVVHRRRHGDTALTLLERRNGR